jgi:hypothetical protein
MMWIAGSIDGRFKGVLLTCLVATICESWAWLPRCLAGDGDPKDNGRLQSLIEAIHQADGQNVWIQLGAMKSKLDTASSEPWFAKFRQVSLLSDHAGDPRSIREWMFEPQRVVES